MDRALSSSSSGHNLPSGLSAGDFGKSGMLDDKELSHQMQLMASQHAQGKSIYSSSKSSITSPIKESIQRGSQEFKKLIGAGSSSSNDPSQQNSKQLSSGNVERYQALTMPSSSTEKVTFLFVTS